MSFDWPCSGVMRRGRDVAPAGDLLSFASPKESRQRKGDPAGCDPSLRCGQPAPRRCRGALQNSLRALRCARTAAASQSTKQLLPHAAQLPPRHRHVAGASRRDPSERAIASLGLRQGEPLRGGYSLPLPLGEGRGEGTGRWMRRVVPRPRALTPTLSQRERGKTPQGQGCAAALLTRTPGPLCVRRGAQRLAEKGPRMFERSEFARTPPAASTAGCPQRSGGTQTVGSPFLC